eukprot:GFUD01007561.1.p1 GENE.GFUD01007561.1~~GFUD01007561.1.p1  ORF type:complete len:335 (+),score=94.57 GFUD01007561.1:172-1176(+)
MSAEKFCLRWNDFESNISSAFKDIRDEKEFFDITIACEDEQLQAHKVILSACSPFFKNVLRRNQHQHPLLYLKGVSFRDMEAVLNFMYHGEVNVAQDDLNSFLQVAEDLRVKGLTQNNSGSSTESQSISAVPKTEPKTDPPRPRPPAYDPTPTAKRPRPSPPAPRIIPQPVTQHDDDIEVIVPVVKSEPRDPTPTTPAPPVQPVVQRVEQEQSLAMYDDGSQMQGSMMEQYDDNYGGEEYEGQFGDQGYDTSMMGPGGQDGSGAGPKDSCPICHKNMLRTNISKHMKMKHSPDDPAECPFCFKVFKTSYNMKDHVTYMHRQRPVPNLFQESVEK